MAKPGEDFYPSDPTSYPGYAGYGSLAWKRAMLAKRLADAGAYPKNIGEGIASAGRDVGDVLMARALQDEEKKQREAEGTLLRGPPGGAGTYAGSSMAAIPAATPSVQTETIPSVARPTANVPADTAVSGFTGANDDPYRVAAVRPTPATLPDGAPGDEQIEGRARLAAAILQQQQRRRLAGNMGNQPLAGMRALQPNSPPGELSPGTLFDPLGRPPQAGFLPYDESNPAPAPRSFNDASLDRPAAMSAEQPAANTNAAAPSGRIQLAAAGGFPTPDTASDEGNPPIVRPDITPIQTAQTKVTPRDYTLGAPSSTSPGARPAPVTRNTDIYGENVPGTFEYQLPPKPGAPPKQPDIPPPTPAMQYWQRVHAADISPEGKEFAKNQYTIHAENQKRAYEAAINQFHFDRQQHAEDVKTYQKAVIEKPVKDLEILKNRLEATKAITRDPADLRQLNLQIQELEQKIKAGVAPKMETILGRLTAWNQEKGVMEDITPKLSNIQLPESTAKKLEMFERMHTAATQLNAVSGPGSHAAALAGYADDKVKGMVPLRTLGFSNYLRSPQYRAADNLSKLWMDAVLRDESGALIGKDEREADRIKFFPVPGDKPADIYRKTALRNAVERAKLDVLGPGKPIAEEYMADRKSRQTDEPDGTIGVVNRTGQKQRVIGGHWEDVK